MNNNGTIPAVEQAVSLWDVYETSNDANREAARLRADYRVTPAVERVGFDFHVMLTPKDFAAVVGRNAAGSR